MTGVAANKRRFTSIHLGKPWCEAIELEDGRQLLLRPIQPSDAPRLRESFRRLTPEEVRMRFMHPIKELTPAYAEHLASIDHSREFALVLVEARAPDEALIGAVARAAIDNDAAHAEFAIIVGSELKNRGLGGYLLGKLIEWCRKKKLESIYGHVLAENPAMLAVTRRLGFRRQHEPDEPDLVRVWLPLKDGIDDSKHSSPA